MRQDILESMHDILVEINPTSRFYTEAECVHAYYRLPESIKSIFREWGARDTVARDMAFEFLKTPIDKD